MPITPTGTKNESKNEKYKGDTPQSKPVIRDLWRWDCINKEKAEKPCTSKPTYVPVNTPAPEKCPPCGGDEFRKYQGDIKEVKHEGKTKIIDVNSKDSSGKPGKILEED